MSINHVKNKKERIAFKIVMILLNLKIIIDFIVIGAKNILVMSSTGKLTLLIYGIIGIVAIIVFIINKMVSLKSIITYNLFIFIFVVSYLTSGKNNQYYFGESMLLVYLFFVPLIIISTYNIKEWGNFIIVMKPYLIPLFLIATFGYFLFDYSKVITYMEYSYSILPIVVSFYWCYAIYNSKIYLVFFIAGLTEIFVFGSRGAVFSLIFFILLYSIFIHHRGKYTVIKRIIIIVGYIVAYLCFNYFYDYICNKVISMDISLQYTVLGHMLNNNILNIDTRKILYQRAWEIIFSDPFTIRGFFSDRVLLQAIYVHNFFIEIWLDFGLIFGSLLIIILINLVIHCLTKPKDESIRDTTLFFVSVLLLKYLFTSSFLIDGNFYLCIFALLSINRQIKGRVKLVLSK